MLVGKRLRWNGAGVGNSSHRLLRIPATHRSISLQTHTRPLQSSRLRNIQCMNQARSLSFFGWGGSSQPSAPSTNSSTKTQEVEIGNSSLNEVRTFKASHATSDAPDPSISHHAVSPVEPPIVEGIQERVAFPSASENVAGIMKGDIDISSIPERVGYLKEVCGLDYGWGPTAFVEWILEQLHVTGGLGWATSIIVLAALTRLALVQPSISAQRESAKMKELNPVIAPLREKANQYMKEGNRQKQLEVTTEMRSIYKEYDLKLYRMFLPLVIQLPIQFGAFRLLNAAGRLPVPGFVDESWLWNHDLSFSDPYFLTPAISSFLMWLQIKQQAKTQTTGGPMSPELTRLIGNLLPVMSLVFMSWQPGAVQLYFATTSLFALVNGEALRRGTVRRYLALPALTPPTASSTDSVAGSSPSSPSAGSNSTVRSSSVAQKNGFQLRSKTVVVDDVKPATSDRSAIDKFIDRAKDKKWGQNWKEVKEKWGQTSADKQREQDEKYETTRSQQLDLERDMRNSAAREKSSRR